MTQTQNQDPHLASSTTPTDPATGSQEDEVTSSDTPAAGAQEQVNDSECGTPEQTGRRENEEAPRTSTRPANDSSKRAEHTRQATHQESGFRLLSTLLEGVPPEELHLVLDHYEDAVARGTIKAVPLEASEPFSVAVINPQGKRLTRRVEDEIVLPDEAFHAWLKAQRKASRLAVLAVTGRVETSLEKLESGDDNFQKLVEIRRKRLQKTRSTARPGKAGQ